MAQQVQVDLIVNDQGTPKIEKFNEELKQIPLNTKESQEDLKNLGDGTKKVGKETSTLSQLIREERMESRQRNFVIRETVGGVQNLTSAFGGGNGLTKMVMGASETIFGLDFAIQGAGTALQQTGGRAAGFGTAMAGMAVPLSIGIGLFALLVTEMTKAHVENERLLKSIVQLDLVLAGIVIEDPKLKQLTSARSLLLVEQSQLAALTKYVATDNEILRLKELEKLIAVNQIEISKRGNELEKEYGKEEEKRLETSRAIVLGSTEALQMQLTSLKENLNQVKMGSAEWHVINNNITTVEEKIKRFTDSLQKPAPVGSMVQSLLGLSEFSPEIDFKTIDFDKIKNSLATAMERTKLQIPFEADVKGFEQGLKDELQVIDEWETTGLKLFEDNEDMKTRITAIAVGQRAKLEKDKAEDTKQFLMSSARSAISSISQLQQNAYAKEIQRLEKEKDQRLTKIDDEQKSLEKAGLQDSEQYKNLTDQKLAIEEEYNAKIREEKKRAFEAQKVASLIEVAINTAIEISRVLATPWMIPIIAALGAVQAGIIASQPTPEFARGTSPQGFVVPPGYGNDTFPIRVSSGERVKVETPGQQKSSGNTVHIHFNSPVPHGTWLKKSIEQGIRKSGLTVDKYFVSNRNLATI